MKSYELTIPSEQKGIKKDTDMNTIDLLQYC